MGASQYKAKTALHKIEMRNMLTIWVFFETSHGKSKSDGLGGVVKLCQEKLQQMKLSLEMGKRCSIFVFQS